MPDNQISANEEFMAMMRKREAREAHEAELREAERTEAKTNRGIRVARRKEGDSYEWSQLQKKQASCDHRKGTSGSGPKTKHIDYNVNRHTFASGLIRIKCEKCRMKWYRGDTAEFLIPVAGRNAAKIPNHTGISYAQAYSFTLEENTTNKESRAEMIVQGPVPQSI